MAFWKRLLKKTAYHVAHPLLRLYRRFALTRDSARAIVLCRGEVLLIRNIGVPYWSFPGGIMNKGEAPEQCVLRELHEELDIAEARIDFKLGTYAGVYRGKDVLVHVFVVEVPSLRHKRQWEIDEARWFLLSDLHEPLSPATKKRLEEFVEGKREVKGVW